MRTADQEPKAHSPLRNGFLRAIYRGLSAVCVTACVTAAAAGAMAESSANATTKACAARDLKLAIMLEARGNTQEIAPDKLATALRTMTWARAACAQGREREALAIYDSIELGPVVAGGVR